MCRGVDITSIVDAIGFYGNCRIGAMVAWGRCRSVVSGRGDGAHVEVYWSCPDIVSKLSRVDSCVVWVQRGCLIVVWKWSRCCPDKKHTNWVERATTPILVTAPGRVAIAVVVEARTGRFTARIQRRAAVGCTRNCREVVWEVSRSCLEWILELYGSTAVV